MKTNGRLMKAHPGEKLHTRMTDEIMEHPGVFLPPEAAPLQGTRLQCHDGLDGVVAFGAIDLPVSTNDIYDLIIDVGDPHLGYVGERNQDITGLEDNHHLTAFIAMTTAETPRTVGHIAGSAAY